MSSGWVELPFTNRGVLESLNQELKMSCLFRHVKEEVDQPAGNEVSNLEGRTGLERHNWDTQPVGDISIPGYWQRSQELVKRDRVLAWKNEDPAQRGCKEKSISEPVRADSYEGNRNSQCLLGSWKSQA